MGVRVTKTVNKLCKAMLCCALVGSLCASPLVADQAYAADKEPKLSVTSKALAKGKTFTLKIKNASGKKVKWSSTNKKVATVSKYGKVKAKKTGKATIVAKVAGEKLTCKVTVIAKPGKPKVTSLTYRPGKDDPYRRKATAKWAKVKGATGYQVAVRWASDSSYRDSNNQKRFYTSWDSAWKTLAFTRTSSLAYTLPGPTKYGYTGLKIKVRAYKKVNGQKIYGSWSNVAEQFLQVG
jgi:Bacterial surface proteins containing Ig-like domains